VVARDNAGADPYFQAQTKVTIAVRDINEPNSLPAGYAMNVNENVALGTAVGTVTATDLDLASTAYGQQRYYFYNSGVVSGVSSDSRYTIDATTGQIRTNAALDFEAGNTSVPYTVVARDNQGLPGTGAIFRDSFEEVAVPTIGHRSDGGWTSLVRVTDSPSQGNGALRAAMWGSHSWTFPGSSFVAAESTVTLSVMVRDSGVTNASVTGGWSGSNVDAAHPVLLGLHNQTTDTWITATNATATKPPNGGAWVRHVQTISGLTVGQTYSVSAMMWAYDGARASDIDALQVEYGSVATPFVGWSQAFSMVTVGINDVNERPDTLTLQSQSLHSETLPGDLSHSGRTIASFNRSDPDKTIPSLAILGDNATGWLTTSGGNLNFASGVNFSASYLRGALGTNGHDAGWYHDSDGDGLKEIRVATLTLAAVDAYGLQGDPFTYNVLIEDTNERPNGLTLQSQTLHSEVVAGMAGHPGKTIATFAMSDPDAVSAGGAPSLAIVGGNGNGWFTTNGGSLNFHGANFTAEWFRSGTLGAYGQDAGFYYDNDGDGLKEIRVATLSLAAVDSRGLQGDPFSYNVFIEDTNERPYALTLQSQTLHSEVLAGEAGHPGKTIATFAVSDPDGISGGTASLAIVGGNGNGWFTTNGASLSFHGANFTAEWFRSGTLGAYGQDAGWYYDSDGDGLKEIRVATLSLAAVDSRGLQGDPFSYNVFIEDKNEAPNWNSAAYAFGLSENPASYAWVGTVAGSDVDGPAGELRYGFADWSIYYDGNIGYVSRSPDGRFLINSQNGNVHVNGATTLDYESAQKSFSYSTTVVDRAAGANSLSRAGTLTVNLQNTNDSPTWYTQVPAGFTVMENIAVGTIVSNGVRATDSDGFGIGYSIDQATNPYGAFGVNSSGQIYVAGAIDHEQTGWLVDSSGKYANLRVLASDGGAPAAEIIKINIGNVRKYVYNNGALDYNLYEMRHQSTNMGGNGEPGFYQQGYYGYGGYGQQSWYNEAWLVEKSTGLVLSWMGEYSQWENTTSRPFPHAGSLAEGYVGYGTYPNPYTMYADQEDIMTGIGGVPQGSPYYPIVFDLAGDGFDLAGVKESGVTTDLNKDGIPEGSGWVKPSDGFLVLDRNGDGLVLDWSEISFVKDKAGASTDLEGLVAFDSNGDFKLAAGDARFGEFRLWVDSNQDGIGQSGELRSLTDAGIVSVSLVRENIKPLAGSITANSVLATAAFERSDGSVGQVGDVALGRLPQRGPDPEPGAPKFHFDQPAAAGSQARPEAAAAPGGPEAGRPSAQSAQAHTDLAPQAAELAARSFTGTKDRYSLAVSGGGLFVTGNKPQGAIDSRVQAVRSESLLSFRNGTIGLVAPVILDLDGDGVELKRRGKSDARFDMDGNGSRDDTGWISRQDGFLVMDLDGDGRITSRAELSLLGLKPDAGSGLDALATLDSDKNGSIDAKDARFGELKLWVDSNGNGITDSGELRSLADRGIASIGLAARAATDSTVKIGRNAMLATSTFTRTDGSIGSAGEAALAFRAGKSTGGAEGALRQIAADAGAAAAAGGAVDRDRALGERLESLRAGLNSRPFLSLAAEGDSVFDRFERAPVPAARENSLRRMDLPALQVPVHEEETAQAEAAAVVPAADDLRLAKMVQDMASFGLRSGEAEWKNRDQTAPSFDYFA
jgi:hypothetical protein